MDLRQMRQFVAVAEERSFRRAAERLHVSQPPLSVALQRLEAEIGVRLLERSPQGVRLTVAGEVFLEESRRTLANAALSVEMAQRAATGRTGALRFSFVPSAGVDVVPRLLREYRASHPHVKLMLRPETTSHQLAALADGTVDVGIVVPPLHEGRHLRLEPFCERELALAVPAAHPLASRKRIQLRQLASESFVGLLVREGPGFESVVLAACQDCGFVPRFVETAAQMQAVLALVAAGVGVALVPDAMRAVAVRDVRYLQVRNGAAPVRYGLGLVWNPANANPALPAFTGLVRELAG